MIGFIDAQHNNTFDPLLTANPNDVLVGRTFSQDGKVILTGTMPYYGSKTITPTDATQTLESGKYDQIIVNARPTLSGTAQPSQVLSGATFYSNTYTKQSGTIPSLQARTIMPSTTTQTINAGNYLAGNQSIAGSPSLINSNIRKGVSIFGVLGGLEAGNANIVIKRIHQKLTFSNLSNGSEINPSDIISLTPEEKTKLGGNALMAILYVDGNWYVNNGGGYRNTNLSTAITQSARVKYSMSMQSSSPTIYINGGTVGVSMAMDDPSATTQTFKFYANGGTLGSSGLGCSAFTAELILIR